MRNVCQNFQYSQPDHAEKVAAIKKSARCRSRRKRLLEARQSVLEAEELAFWKGVTIDFMSDEEDGSFEEASGSIVRPPSFCSQELSDLCLMLQRRLKADPKGTPLNIQLVCSWVSESLPNLLDHAAEKHVVFELSNVISYSSSSAYPGPGRGGSRLSRDTQTSLSPDTSSSSSRGSPRRSQASRET
ncbi:hypothetical protein ILYODFUR_012523 [Ilyodon furcidens]|uniref:Uncharacterized protein n=1 Tax=Ilyodon furcidens TaxID=33524 RepID=A0ABV0V4J9_9TELE